MCSPMKESQVRQNNATSCVKYGNAVKRICILMPVTAISKYIPEFFNGQFTRPAEFVFQGDPDPEGLCTEINH